MMAKPIRIGILGLSHDHVWINLETLSKLTDGTLVAIADPHQDLLDRVKEAYGCPTYLSYEEMLEKEELDAVSIFCDNATGADLTVWAAERGLQVMINLLAEKCLFAVVDFSIPFDLDRLRIGKTPAIVSVHFHRIANRDVQVVTGEHPKLGAVTFGDHVIIALYIDSVVAHEFAKTLDIRGAFGRANTMKSVGIA